MDAAKIIQDRTKILNLMAQYPILVTTSNWFRAKDGFQYLAAWGHARLISASALLGFEPTNSANWLLVFDGGEDTLIIGGCQVNYIQICPRPPVGKDILLVFTKDESNG